MRSATLVTVLMILALALGACTQPPPAPPATPSAPLTPAVAEPTSAPVSATAAPTAASAPTSAPVATAVPVAPTAAPTVVPPTSAPAAATAPASPLATAAPAAAAQIAAGQNALAGTSWTLATLGGQPPVQGTTVTADFGQDGKLTGTDGCNNYSTSYTADATKIKIDPRIASTMMACPDPIMKQADAYTKALPQAATYKVDGSTLTLSDAAGKPLATFNAQNAGGPQSTPLAGTSWLVTGFNNGKQAVVSVINGTTLTANFGQDGKVTGSAGCNNYTADYKTSGQEITIWPPAATRKMCAEPAGVMEQEAAYLAALQAAGTYRIDGQKLELRSTNGALVATLTAQTAGLPGTSWQAIGYNNGKGAVASVANGTTITANFGPDGRLSGNAGCNDYTAEYTIQGQNITIGKPAVTLKACSQPAGVMQQETAYLAALQTAATYTMDGGKLELRTKSGALAADFAQQSTSLAGTSWQAVSYNNGKQAVVSVAAGTTITANFGQDGKLSGNAGCNDYTASYETNGQNIKIGQAAATMKACGQAGVMEQEAAYLAALQQAATYRTDGQKLELRDANGALLAEFTAQSTGLAGSAWLATGYNNGKDAVVSVMPGSTITADFGQAGLLSGNAGCNDYSAGYHVSGQNITIGPIAATQRACLQFGLMDQETAYLAALQTAATYRMDAGKLELRDASGALVATYTVQNTDLAGTAWAALYYNNGRGAAQSVALGTRITAIFGSDGQLTGNAGCNDYNAGYQVSGHAISIGAVNATRKMCAEPTGVMEQEAAYLAALPAAALYRIDGNDMELRDAEGAIVAQYTRIPMPAAPKPTAAPAPKATAAPAAPATQPPAAPAATAAPVSATPAPVTAQPAAAAAPTTLQPNQVSLNTMGLPYSYQPVLVPATPYDASSPPGPKGLPEHIEVLFGATKPADRKPGTPIMYIIPVDAYRQMYDAAGNPGVSQTIDAIYKNASALPNPAPATLPALPYEEITGRNDLAVQVGLGPYTNTSASKTGYRFVGRWAQDANPVTNQNLKYVYQGFTNDGRYLVSFFYPVTTAKLPDSPAQMSSNQMAAFNADPAGYIAQQAQMLNTLAPTDWNPDLKQLDAVVASLQIQDMPPSGLVDQVWTWVDVVPGGGVKPLTDKTRSYQALFMINGTLIYTADCNQGAGTFTYKGGMVGSVRTTLGAATLAECNDNGQGQQFTNALMAGQNYKVRPGGTTMELVLPAGGGSLVMTNQK